MPTFSSSEIEEAKRRVREMQSRADSYVSGGKPQEKVNIPKPPREEVEKQSEREKPSKTDELFSSDDSFITILLLIIILSHEGADNKLLLALIYLLL